MLVNNILLELLNVLNRFILYVERNEPSCEKDRKKQFVFSLSSCRNEGMKKGFLKQPKRIALFRLFQKPLK